MEKVLTIDEKAVRFKCTASFPIVFKAQFGYDLLTILLPALSEVLQGLEDAQQEEELNAGAIGVLLEHVYSIELTHILHMIWALAKSADKELPTPEEWFDSFEEFPIFDVAKELMEIVIPSFISKKNLEKLKVVVKQ